MVQQVDERFAGHFLERLHAARREVRLLSAIPVLWAVVGGSAAVLLNIWADFALLIAGPLLLVFAAAGPHRPDHNRLRKTTALLNRGVTDRETYADSLYRCT